MSESSVNHVHGRWRQGRKAGRTLYLQLGPEPSDDDRLIGIVDTTELAREVVDAVNAGLPRPPGDDPPTARAPWTVTLAWTPDQNSGAVSVMPGRSPVYAIAGRLRAGEHAASVAADYGITEQEVEVLRHLDEDLREAT